MSLLIILKGIISLPDIDYIEVCIATFIAFILPHIIFFLSLTDAASACSRLLFTYFI